MEGALEAGVMPLEAVKLGVEEVDSGLEDADAAQIPGVVDEFIEEFLLEGAARVDFRLIASVQFLEGFAFFGFDDQLL